MDPRKEKRNQDINCKGQDDLADAEVETPQTDSVTGSEKNNVVFPDRSTLPYPNEGQRIRG